MTIAAGLLVLLLLGAGLWRLAAPAARNVNDWIVLAGYALVLGLLGVGLCLRLPSMLGIDALPTWRWLWPALPAVLAWLAVFLWRRPAPTLAIIPPALPRVLLTLVLALIALRLVWIVDEAWLRPLFGWDAWLAWSAKAKAWALAGETVAFVPAQVWLEEPAGSVRISLAHHYPELLSWIEVWLAALAGGWHEPVINLAWPLLWLALLAGCFGQWRVLGAHGLAATIGLYALASLPLLAVHAALPGYADLWIGTCLAFAVLSWLRWIERGERGQLLLAVALLLVLPALKFEGTVWALGCFGLMLWFALSSWKVSTRIAMLLSCAFAAVLVSWLLNLQWLQTVLYLLTPVPDGSGASVFGVLLATAAGMFAQGNWHLLWYLLPLVLLWRWSVLRAHPSLAGVAAFVVGGLLLILVLFLFTHAGRWAESYTVVNRLLMHFTPTVVTLLVLCFRSRPASSTE